MMVTHVDEGRLSGSCHTHDNEYRWSVTTDGRCAFFQIQSGQSGLSFVNFHSRVLLLLLNFDHFEVRFANFNLFL